MTLVRAGTIAAALCLLSAPGGDLAGQAPSGRSVSAITWTLDNLDSLGGHTVTAIGTPRVVQTPVGRAVEFDGKSDGLFLDVNPIAGLERFTVEALVEPAADGPAEQRFLHMSEQASENRAMLEIRILPPGASFCLDTYLRHAADSLTLIDRERAHAAGAWHTVALVYDGATMRHYVDGVRDAEGAVHFAPLGAGRTSIGVRQNKASWFKGRIALVRVAAEALPPGRLLRPTN